MPRVLMVGDSLGGGLGLAIDAGAAWLRGHGWDVVVAAPGADRSPGLDPDREVVDVPPTARDLRGARRAGQQLRDLLARHRPDVVHCHGLRCFAIVRLLARHRAFVTLHGTGRAVDDPVGYGHVRELAEGLLPRLALGAFTAAPGLGDRWRFAPHASPRLGELERSPVPAGSPFLWLARLDHPKQPELLVEAVAAASREAAVRAVVAGSGQLEPQVRELVHRTDAPVELLGDRADVPDLLAASRAVVLLSRAEGLPFALEEAMWAGRAVVTSRLAGGAWLAGDEPSGVHLVDDVAEAAAALVRLSDDDVALADGALAGDRIRSLITPDSPWPMIERAYRAVL